MGEHGHRARSTPRPGAAKLKRQEEERRRREAAAHDHAEEYHYDPEAVHEHYHRSLDAGQRERTRPELIAHEVGSAVSYLGGQKPELLLVVLLVAIVNGAALWDGNTRLKGLGMFLDSVINHLSAVEENRSQELERQQLTMDKLMNVLINKINDNNRTDGYSAVLERILGRSRRVPMYGNDSGPEVKPTDEK